MTLMSFGRAVPIQIDMLGLVGYVDAPRDLIPATTLNARKRAMRYALHKLKRTTGFDFGYDPQRWREFLLDADEEFGYKHPYGFALVDRAVQNAMVDPDVLATLTELKLETDRKE